MTISGTTRPYGQEVVPEGKRLRMKDWLKSRIGDPRYPGLVWLDEKKQIFRIPWKHAALHGWDQNSDGALFRDWAGHTGACLRNAHPKQLKATFRCALHSLPDVHEDKTKAKKKGDGACRVYKFDSNSSTAPKRRHIRIRNHKDNERTRKLNAMRTAGAESTPLRVHAFPEWNSSILRKPFTPNSNNNSNSPTPFASDEKVVSLCEYIPQERQWTTRSEPNIPQGLLQPAVDVASPLDAPFSHEAPMQHSESVPNFTQTYFSEAQSAYYNPALHSAEMQNYFETSPFETAAGANVASCPLSPHNANYNSGHSGCSPLRSPNVDDMGSVNVYAMPHDSPHSSAWVAGSDCHAGTDFQPPTEFASMQQQLTPAYFQEKLASPLDDIVFYDTLQQVASAADHLTSPSESTIAENSTNFQHLQEGTNEQLCPPSFLMEQPSDTQILTSMPPMQRYSPSRREYIETDARPIGQHAIESTIVENQTQEWMPLPRHESLPSAYTLLASTNSPTEKRMPLRWMSTSDGAASPSMSYELLQQSDTFQGMTDSFCDLDALVSDESMGMTTTQSSTTHMYGGHSRH